MSELEPGAVFAGHRIEGIAGRGGMGVVYTATDLRLKRTVALKVIRPQLATEARFQERFERECELAAQVNHPSVVQIYSAGEEDGAAYVTMAFVVGTDLGELIEREGPLDPEFVARLATSVGSALDTAHARGLVHRDVKPANVLVGEGPGGEFFLTDFGLTRELTSDTRFTATGAVIGTLDYMAPEQFEDQRLDGRTDVYALGCVIYQALTGEVPFPAVGPPAKIFAHTSADRPSIRDVVPELPATLDRVVQKAMAVKRGERFQSAGELGQAVEAAVAGTAEEGGETEPVAAAGPVATEPITAPFEDDDTAETAAREATTVGAREPDEDAATTTVKRERQGPNFAGIALAAGAVGIAVVIGILTLGGGDDPGGVTSGDGGGGPSVSSTSSGSGTGDDGSGSGSSGGSTGGTEPPPVELPLGAVALVSDVSGGEIEQTGYDRRVSLVEARGGVGGEEARAQALDELIVNRWLRGEAESRGVEFSEEEVAAEIASPEYAGEVANLRAAGYEEAGVELDTVARLAAKQLYSEQPSVLAALTGGYDSTDYEEFSQLIDEWRPLTGCEGELATLSPLCVNSGLDPEAS